MRAPADWWEWVIRSIFYGILQKLTWNPVILFIQSALSLHSHTGVPNFQGAICSLRFTPWISKTGSNFGSRHASCKGSGMNLPTFYSTFCPLCHLSHSCSVTAFSSHKADKMLLWATLVNQTLKDELWCLWLFKRSPRRSIHSVKLLFWLGALQMQGILHSRQKWLHYSLPQTGCGSLAEVCSTNTRLHRACLVPELKLFVLVWVNMAAIDMVWARLFRNPKSLQQFIVIDVNVYICEGVVP